MAAGADWILQMDSGGQCDPSYLQEFWQLRNEADCIFGDRRKRDDGWDRFAISHICSKLVSFRTGVELTDFNVAYRQISVQPPNV